MITDTSSNIDVSTGDFSIEMNASMFSMLTKNVYNNVILAPIREWSTNAIDACISAGITPHFDVQLPTASDPTFAVRDYGTGLPEQDLIGLFTVLGASTKRNSNEYNGTFGIGRLSALAYSTSFTVESYYQGTHYAYLISIKDGKPVYLKLSETPSSSPNGLRLSLAVQAHDINTFIKEATYLYQFFDVKPTTNIPLTYPEILLEGETWAITSGSFSPRLVMGNVPYSVHAYGVPNGTYFKAPIGSVSITPGRESLTMDAKTEKFLSKLIDTARADMNATINAQLQAKTNLWEAWETVKQARNMYRFNYDYSNMPSFFTDIFDDYNYLKTRPEFKLATIDKYDSKFYSGGVRPSRKYKHVLIQDVASGYFNQALDYIKKYPDETALVLRPNSNSKTSIQALLDAYPDFITKADLPEPVLISSLIPDKQRTTSTKLASHIFKPTWISSSGTSLGENININEVTDTIYYYKEPPPDLSAITKALHILGIKLLIAPKKIHTLISTNPLFVECDDSIISSLLQTKTINYFSQDFEDIRNYFPYQYTKYKSAQYDFVKIHDEIYHKSLANNLYCSATVASALKHFQFTPTELTYPITWSDIENTYPLLNNFRYNQERGQYYINLEDQAHALRSTSGLNRPTLPDS